MAMTRDQLAGGWRLVRWSVEYADGRAPETPFGEDAEGLLLYGLDGWMTATMHERHRTRLSHPSVRLATPESRAAAMTEYLSYGGRWRLEGDGVADVRAWVSARKPQGPWLYPADQPADIPSRILASEVTREKIYLRLHDELPYASMVETEKWEERKAW
jgi:hypothetical protein